MPINIWKEAELAAAVFENSRHVIRFEVNSGYKHVFFKPFTSARDVLSAMQNLYALPLASGAIAAVGFGKGFMHLGLGFWHAGHLHGKKTVRNLGKTCIASAASLAGTAMICATLALAILDLLIKTLRTAGHEIQKILKDPPAVPFTMHADFGGIPGFI